MELIKNHKYLIRELLSQIDVELWQILDVTKTSYNIKLENGKIFWLTKQRFEVRYELIEDLGPTVTKPIKVEKKNDDFIKKVMDEIERAKNKEKFPWEKKQPWSIPEKYTWTNGKKFDMQVTFQNEMYAN